MKKIVPGILLAVLACTWASAESSVWKAEKDGSVIYLGGTCHFLRDSDYPLPPEFDQAYKASEVIVFETDLGKFTDMAVQQKLLAKTIYTDGSTVEQHLSAQAYGELKAYCQSNGIPMQVLGQFKPAMLMMTLMVMELKKAGATQKGVDMFFHEQAGRDGKTIEGLETADQQIDYLVTMAGSNENEFVSYSIRDMVGVKEQFALLADTWRKGDAKALDELMISDLKSKLPNLYRRLITDRTGNWLPSIDAYQKTPRTEFVLVGVAHLVGPDGMVEALGKRGYQVEKVQAAPPVAGPAEGTPAAAPQPPLPQN